MGHYPTTTTISRQQIAATSSQRVSRFIPFGYGLSYTTFKFDNLKVEPQQILQAGTAKVSIEVTNTATREGDEVPQLYIHQRVASVTQPVMQLKGFERITLKPGEKRTVDFTITPEMLSILEHRHASRCGARRI